VRQCSAGPAVHERTLGGVATHDGRRRTHTAGMDTLLPHNTTQCTGGAGCALHVTARVSAQRGGQPRGRKSFTPHRGMGSRGIDCAPPPQRAPHDTHETKMLARGRGARNHSYARDR
jgi:hypothetical protein